MFHTIQAVEYRGDYTLLVRFTDGVAKEYDLKQLFLRWPVYRELENNQNLLKSVAVDRFGYGIVWGDRLDMSSNELYENGRIV